MVWHLQECTGVHSWTVSDWSGCIFEVETLKLHYEENSTDSNDDIDGAKHFLQIRGRWSGSTQRK